MAEKLITKSFERLLDKGKHRGFITYEELGKSLGKRNSTNENLEKAFAQVLANFDKNKKEFERFKSLDKNELLPYIRQHNSKPDPAPSPPQGKSSLFIYALENCSCHLQQPCSLRRVGFPSMVRSTHPVPQSQEENRQTNIDF